MYKWKIHQGNKTEFWATKSVSVSLRGSKSLEEKNCYLGCGGPCLSSQHWELQILPPKIKTFHFGGMITKTQNVYTNEKQWDSLRGSETFQDTGKLLKTTQIVSGSP